MIAKILSPDVAMVLILRAHKEATKSEDELEQKADRIRRRLQMALAHRVTVEGYEAFHGDRWWPGTKLTKYEGVQVVDRDRAWLGKGANTSS